MGEKLIPLLEETAERFPNWIVEEPRIGHIFIDCAIPHFKGFSRFVVDLFNSPKIYLCDTGYWRDQKEAETENNEALSRLKSGVYCGFLNRAYWKNLRHLSSKVKAWLGHLMPDFSMKSFWLLFKGPKNYVIHGWNFSVATILLLRLMGKRVVVLHWGGGGPHGRSAFLSRCALRLLTRHVVLMEPELRYFRPFLGKKSTLLPYIYSLHGLDYEKEVSRNPGRVIMLGNNANYRETYCEILDKLIPGEWDRIICMMNYGGETTGPRVDAFIQKYKEKFGDSFFPWRETVPLEEYLKIMDSVSFYVCCTSYQAGLGAVMSAYRKGQTVLLRGDNLNWMKYLGVKVVDIDAILDFSYAALNRLRFNERECRDNFITLQRFYDVLVTPEKWKAAVCGLFM